MKVVAKERAQRAISETGTGFACAKLSEVLPPVANAPVVRMTQNAKLPGGPLLPLALLASSG
jgi:hypothetical protein